jgi:hypothetical protein
MIEYKPFRILKTFSFPVASMAELETKYPSAILEPVPRRSPNAPLTGLYREGKVIDVPSAEELSLFESIPDFIAAVIPQHRDGFDDPRSGIARSRKGSWEGRQKWMRFQAIQAANEKMRIAARSHVDPRPADVATGNVSIGAVQNPKRGRKKSRPDGEPSGPVDLKEGDNSE